MLSVGVGVYSFFVMLLSLFDPMEIPFLGDLPLYVVLLIGLAVVFILWKLIKFTIKVVLVLAVFFLVLIGLDVVGVFSWLQELLYSFA